MFFNAGDTVYRGTRGQTPTHVVVSTNGNRMTVRNLTDGTESTLTSTENGWNLYEVGTYHFWTRELPHVPAMPDPVAMFTGQHWNSQTAMFGCGV